ncbi:hypothetical protein DFH09DRAFT_1289489 [Mycena vulgaris]|nr:hypothetical protein DFH09DRAFT_1289489 [Mycena vulgaris]
MPRPVGSNARGRPQQRRTANPASRRPGIWSTNRAAFSRGFIGFRPSLHRKRGVGVLYELDGSVKVHPATSAHARGDLSSAIKDEAYAINLLPKNAPDAKRATEKRIRMKNRAQNTCPAPSGYRSTGYSCYRATVPSSTCLIQKADCARESFRLVRSPTTPLYTSTGTSPGRRAARRRASALRPKMYSSQERAEAPQSQLPLHLLPAYATPRDGVLRLRRASTSACDAPRRSRPVSLGSRPAKQTSVSPSGPKPSSASDVPPQTEAAAALNGWRREGGGVGVTDVVGCGGRRGVADEGESGVGASSRAVGVGGGRPAVGMVHRRRAARGVRALLGTGASLRARVVGGTLVHQAILKRSALWMAGGALSPHQGMRAAGKTSPAAPTSPSRRPHNPLLHSPCRGPGASAPVPALDLAPAALQRGHLLRSECGSAASCSTSFMSFVCARVLRWEAFPWVWCMRTDASSRRSAQAISVAAGDDMDGGADTPLRTTRRESVHHLPSISPLPTRGRLVDACDLLDDETSDDVASSTSGWIADTAQLGSGEARGATSNACVVEGDGRGGGKIAVEDGERRQRGADEGWARKHIDGMGPLHVIASKRHKEEREWMGMTESESAECACARLASSRDK